jgi:glycosyltransferase involved in cell wall biosynthesis
MLSVIIPSRNEEYLANTVNDLFAKAGGEIEIIVVLDGHDSIPEDLPKDERLKTILNPVAKGMRNAINSAAAMATGKYLMKCDAHCCFDKDFDLKMIADCEPNWVMVPRRYTLDKKKWDRKDDYYEFQYIGHPKDEKYPIKGCDWPEYAKRVEGQELCDLMTFQGSCWFMHKEWFEYIEGEDEKHYGTMGAEAQEICLKTWLGGGKCVLTRRTWYSHAKKRVSTYGYKKPLDEWKKSRKYAIKCWTKGKWHKQVRDLRWLIKYFKPIPTWHFKESVVTNRIIQEKYGLNIGDTYPRTIKGLNRRGLYELFKELGFTKGAEVGVFRGANAKVMYETIPNLHLILVDQYSHYTGERSHNRTHDVNEEMAHDKLDMYNPTWIRKVSEDAFKEVEDESLDFVYIDGNHKYEFVMLDIIFWLRKVRKGGIISGHDFYNTGGHSLCNAKQAVLDFTNALKIEPLYLTDESAVENRSDRHASWFFIKG